MFHSTEFMFRTLQFSAASASSRRCLGCFNSMIRKIKGISLALLLVAIHFYANAQADSLQYPEVGKPCPEFVLQNIRYYPQKKAALRDFRGKWLLLDFWNRNCGSCITGFPHMNDIQKDLGDKVQVMMVGIQDPERMVEKIYAKYRASKDLTMPCAFDSALAQRFDISATPRYVLIDDKGIVQGYTNVFHIEDMRAFLAGQHPYLSRAYRRHEEAPKDEVKTNKYDQAHPFMLNGNGAPDSNYLFRSLFAKWDPSYKFLGPDNIEQALMQHPGRFEVLGCPLKDLYLYAFFGASSFMGPEYYGQYSDKLVMEISDSSMFKWTYLKNGQSQNLFCYSLEMRLSSTTEPRIKTIMQRDLENYFGYSASLETRKTTYWAISGTPGAIQNVKAKGGEYYFKGDAGVGFITKNCPFESLVTLLRYNNQSDVILDETGIVGNVDLNMDCEGCVLTDLKGVKKALQANGLDLVQKEKDMKVVVVRDGVTRPGKIDTARD